MNKTLVRLLARHLRMELYERLPYVHPDYGDRPDLKDVGRLKTVQLKWLYNLAYQAVLRHKEAAHKHANKKAGDQINLHPHLFLAQGLLLLFRRAVRLQFDISDEYEFVIGHNWRIYLVSGGGGGCAKRGQQGKSGEDCDGDCADCDQQDDCNDCGPNCKTLGGTGCGKPDCSCEEPDEDIPRVDIRGDFDRESFINLRAVGQCLAGLKAEKSADPQADLSAVFCINEPMYRAMKQAIGILTHLTDICEQREGWRYDDEDE